MHTTATLLASRHPRLPAPWLRRKPGKCAGFRGGNRFCCILGEQQALIHQPCRRSLDRRHIGRPIADQKLREQVLNHLWGGGDSENSGFATLELARPLAE